MMRNSSAPPSSRFLRRAVWLVLALLAVGIVALDVNRRRLRREVTDLQLRTASFAEAQLPAGSVEAGRDRTVDQPGDKTLQLALIRARGEVADLEAAAIARRQQMLTEASQRRTADAAALAADNRDPEAGLTKLEYFRNVGQQTPSAALQTLIWAAMNGDEQVLARGFVLDDRARERATIVLAQLPPSANIPATPEALAALWFEQTVLELPVAYITGATLIDDTHVTLNVRGGLGRDQPVPMQLGPAGWQFVVREHGIEVVQQRLLGPSTPAP